MKRTLTIVAVLVAAQAALVVVYLGLQRGAGDGRVSAERLSGRAPDLELTSAEGTVSRIAELRGSTVVLHFWATWCPPCREELPSLFEFAATGDVEVLAVSVDPTWGPVRSFVPREALRHVYLASGDAVSDAFGVDELPQTFVIDPVGTLRLRFRGSRDWSSRALRETIGAIAAVDPFGRDSGETPREARVARAVMRGTGGALHGGVRPEARGFDESRSAEAGVLGASCPATGGPSSTGDRSPARRSGG